MFVCAAGVYLEPAVVRRGHQAADDSFLTPDQRAMSTVGAQTTDIELHGKR